MQSLEVGTQHHPLTATRQSSHVQHHARPNTLMNRGSRLGRNICGGSVVAHLRHLLLVQLEHLARAGGGNLLKGQVARMGAVTTVPSQHKDHLENRQIGLCFLL